MTAGLFYVTTQQILSFENYDRGSTRALILESQNILEAIEQLNLHDEHTVGVELKKVIIDFMGRCGRVILDVHGKIMLNPERARLTTERALDWIYDCQEVLLNQDRSDESEVFNLTTEEG